MPRTLGALLLVLAAAVVIAGCTVGDPDNDSRSATAGLPDLAQELSAGEWLLDGGDQPITLVFGDEVLSGSGSCNSYTAEFSLDGTTIDIGTIAQTQQACEAAVMDAEAAYLAALEAVTDVDLDTDGERLELTGDDDVALAFDRVDTYDVLLGSWEITNVNTGDAIVSPVAGTEPTLTFSDEGRVSMDTGCNTAVGDWELAGADITVADLAQTQRACPEPEGVGDQEAALVAALERTQRVQVTSDQLTLLDDAGLIAISAVKGS